ncbi:hypothetical protein ACO0SA_004903 [Hanseniaspora valbyensis]
MARRSNKNKKTFEEQDQKKEEYISSESSSSEEEDDHGDLINEKVDDDIAKVMSLLKNNEIDKLLDKENQFFKDEHFKLEKKTVDKPLYLKDYQRELLLKQNEEEEEKKPFKTYQEEQDDQKKEILEEINAEISDANKSDDDEDFFVKKEKKTSIKPITDVLPDVEEADSDEEKKDEFLQQFLNKQAWIPKIINEKGEITVARETDALKEMEPIQDDDEEFDEAAEKFENAYNFRYEDPNSVEVVSYARQQATLRRDQLSSRQKKRLAQKEEKVKESNQVEQELNKTVTKMSNQMKDIIVAIEKEYGKKIDEAMVSKLSDLLIDGEFDMNDWDGLVNELFNEDFYNEEGQQEIPEGMEGEFAEEVVKEEDDNEKPVAETKKLSKKKQKQLEKDLAKKNAAKLDNIIEGTLESKKLNIMDTIKAPEERGRSKKQDKEMKFKYREVSPNSFGLELREIFLAEDENLNEFMPIRNFTNYKKKEEIQRERKKMLKNGRRLKTWREKHPLNFDIEELQQEENRDKKKHKKSKK